MFGYIKPAHGELRMVEHEFYRAAYCGLCKSMGKCTGCLSRMTLSYDFVFLALLRYALTGEDPKVETGRCMVHPFRRRPILEDSEALRFSASAAAILTNGKIKDDIADEKGVKRLGAGIVSPFTASAAKRAGMTELSASVTEELSNLSSLEAEGCGDVDRAADCFGRLLGEVAAFGLEGAESRIAREIGRYTGRFIYVIDAVDDIAEDKKRGRYNPFLCSYGDDILEEREVLCADGKRKRRTVIRRNIAEGILTAAKLDLMGIERAENLVSYGDSRESGMVRGIIHNTIGMGMPLEMMRVLGLADPDKRDRSIYDHMEEENG